MPTMRERLDAHMRRRRFAIVVSTIVDHESDVLAVLELRDRPRGGRDVDDVLVELLQAGVATDDLDAALQASLLLSHPSTGYTLLAAAEVVAHAAAVFGADRLGPTVTFVRRALDLRGRV